MNKNERQSDLNWQKIVLKYTQPDLKTSIWQLSSTLVLYALLWFLMYKSLAFPYWVTLLLSLPASGLLIRLFIFFHDCGHGSFFKSKKVNRIIGNILGVLTFTPYDKWHHQHHIHHATNSNLDKRGIGDVWVLTVNEYLAASKWQRIHYRVYRNPLVLLILGPILLLFVFNRTTKKEMARSEKRNIHFTNLMILLTGIGLSLLIGFKAYLLIQLPVILISHIAGVWLFYVQHQFEDAVWERNEDWDYKNAALSGSSYLKLPKLLQWFTGNIGYHHVHHLSSKIANYRLEKCHFENELFRNVKPITLLSSFESFKMNLWDEANKKMVSFRKVPERKKIPVPG